MTALRLQRLRARMRELSLDALLVGSPANVRYLTGFSGSNGLAVVSLSRACFVTDSRYRLQSAREVHGFRRLIARRGLLEESASAGLLRGCATLGFESDTVSYARYRQMRSLFGGIALRPVESLVEDIACVKDAAEIAILSEAARIADRVFLALLPSIRPGITELDVAAEISWLTRRHGAEGDAFDVIVASGPRGALPHARATRKKITRGEFVTLDFGARVQGYSSDLTRTVAIGHAPRALRAAYRAVQSAQQGAIEAARGGMPARELDAVARRHLASFGLARYFIHSLGHGLGLHIHERPRIAARSVDTLQSGSVITIEPGIYIPNVGGVRIEDDVLLTENGCRLLTASSRELMIL